MLPSGIYYGTTMKKILKIAALALLLLLAVLIVRAFLLPSRQVRASASAPALNVQVDPNAAAARLAGALRFQTISREGAGPVDPEAFLALHRYLEQSFPRVHATLTREVVAGYSLLYTWPGKNPSLPPVVLLSHLDVVPVEAGTERSWTQPPFAGLISDGFIWGRGALDDKAGVLALLESVELLVARGFQPERTVYLAFGHDEEVGGLQGRRAWRRCWRSAACGRSSCSTKGVPSSRGWCRGSPRPSPWSARPRRAM